MVADQAAAFMEGMALGRRFAEQYFNERSTTMGRKIKVEYDPWRQLEFLDGPFIFIRDGNKIRNLELR